MISSQRLNVVHDDPQLDTLDVEHPPLQAEASAKSVGYPAHAKGFEDPFDRTGDTAIGEHVNLHEMCDTNF